jgi:anti-sigma regulatory factor (Ser/Thr protein kinase)
MRKLDIAPLTQWITAAAMAHPHDLPAHVQQRLGIGRRSAMSLLARLQAASWLARDGTARRPQWRPGPLRQVVMTYPLQGLMEDLPWRQDFAPHFELQGNVRRLAQHAFTELVNNAIDHSGGTQVTVSMRQTAAHLQLLVSDDGCGLFRRVEESFAISEPRVAMLEIAKGRLTSQPDRHCGQGLVLTAQLADIFDLRANAAGFQRRAWSAGQWHGMPPPAALADRPGTSVFLAIALDTPRTLDEVQRSRCTAADSYAFDEAHVPLNLLTAGGDALASRADAKRVASRLADFRRAQIDFAGIDEVGHAFAHELFSVFQRTHPGVELVPVAASPRVVAILSAVQA